MQNIYACLIIVFSKHLLSDFFRVLLAEFGAKRYKHTSKHSGKQTNNEANQTMKLCLISIITAGLY